MAIDQEYIAEKEHTEGQIILFFHNGTLTSTNGTD